MKRNKKRQRKQFAKSADKTKKINVNPKIMRGGIRL